VPTYAANRAVSGVLGANLGAPRFPPNSGGRPRTRPRSRSHISCGAATPCPRHRQRVRGRPPESSFLRKKQSAHRWISVNKPNGGQNGGQTHSQLCENACSRLGRTSPWPPNPPSTISGVRRQSCSRSARSLRPALSDGFSGIASTSGCYTSIGNRVCARAGFAGSLGVVVRTPARAASVVPSR